jgi:PAS domain S-box-containing protein
MSESLKIVQLDNSLDGATVARHALNKANLSPEIRVAGTRDEFIKTVIDFPPDIILSEFSLPGIHCSQALEILRQYHIHIPFIIVSNDIADGMAMEILRIGADDYVLKNQIDRLPFAILRSLEKYEFKSDQQNLLEQLTNSEERFRTLVENSADAVVVLSAEAQPIYVSPAVKNVLGYTAEEIYAMDIFSKAHPDDVPQLMKVMGKVLASPGIPIKGHTGRMMHKDGSWRWIEATVTNMLHEPAINGIVDNFRDVTEIEKSRQALQSSENNLRAIFENTSEGFVLTDTNATIVYFNSKARYFYKISTGNEIETGTSLADSINDERSGEYNRAINAVLAGELRQYEHMYAQIEGKKSWLNVTMIPVVENGRITGLTLTMTDITDQKLAQDLLQRSESNLNAIMNNTDALIYSLDTDLRYITYNNALEDMMKERYDIDIQPGYHILESLNKFDPGSETEWTDINSRALSGEILKFEKELPYNGSSSHLRFSIHPIKKKNTVTGLSCFVNDITKEKQSDEKVLKALEEKNVILESIGDCFFAVDKNWIVTYWNKQAEIVLNTPKENILGKNIWDIFPDVVDTLFHIYYQKAIDQNTIQHFESYYERGKAWFEVTAYPSASGLSVYLREITQRKHDESRLHELNKNLQSYTEELIDSNKGLEQFSYIVSHNLRAPVANIIGLAELLSQHKFSPAENEELLQGVLVNVKRLDDIVSDLNTILQVKREVSENREPVEMQQLVDNIRSSIYNIIERENVEIRTDFSALNKIITLRSYLHSIFYNLIINSIKYRQKDIDPVIKIKSEVINGEMIISFQDNGLGIDLKKKGKHLFGLYKRFHHHVEGKGMGLFMVKTQVEMLGGKIVADSTVDKGTEFRILFRSDNL